MPELPEVENIALGLREIITGREVQCIRVQTGAIIRGPERRRWRRFMVDLAGQHVERVTRRAKRLILAVEGHRALVFQLGMTGKFLLPDAAKDPDTMTAKHTRVIIPFAGGPTLRFVDSRRFGRLWLLPDLDPDAPDAAMEAAGLTPLGPEALSMRPRAFAAILNTARPVKSLLLDQGRIAGLGNIYVDESLWAAGIHPGRSGRSLTAPEAAALLRQIKAILRRAIRAGGTTLSDFRNPYGDMGRFRRRLKVYRRHGKGCKRCGTPIERLVITGRGTHVCPRCQA